MAKENFNWIQGLTLVLGALLLVGSLTWFAPVGAPTPVNQIIDTSNLATKADLDNISDKLNSIDTQINEDDLWKQNAIDLATAEWSKNDNKAIFNVLRHIDERKDIENIVVKDFEVTGLDTDNEDAIVTQELKVYYEDDSGDNVKDYVTVTTYIKDGEVDEQEVDLA